MEVELTEARKIWLQEHHPQGIVWEYDPDKPFAYLGIPYRTPHTVDGKPTIAKTIVNEETDKG